MEKDNRDQQLDQLLRGVSGLCASKEDCTDCPFHGSECFFGEPKPRTWNSNDTEPVKEKEESAPETAQEPEEEVKVEPEAAKAPAPEAEKPAAAEPAKAKEDTQGTWLVSTTMGTVFSKYVFICSKCGYKKESFLSVAPTANCPECEKNRLNGLG